MAKRKIKPGEYDSQRMSELLRAAKGRHRTGAQFCQESGISTPTFSRFLNQHNVRPCTKEFLRKIADHADPDSGVTFEMLLEANGGTESLNDETVAPLSNLEITGLITTALLMQQYCCQRSVGRDKIDVLGLTYQPTLSLQTDALDGKNLKTYDFIFWNQYSKSVNIEADRMIRQLLIINSAINLDYIVFDRLSFVFTNNTLFQNIINRIKDLKLEVSVTLILVDPAQRNIQKEYIIPLCSGEQKGFLTNDTDLPPQDSSLLSIDEQNLL